MNPPTVSPFFKIALTILGLLNFHMNFRIRLSNSTRKPRWDFDRDCVKSVDQFGKCFNLDSNRSFDP